MAKLKSNYLSKECVRNITYYEMHLAESQEGRLSSLPKATPMVKQP